MSEVTYGIGIDPGWKNLGYAVARLDTDGTITFIGSGTFDPSSYKDIPEAAYTIHSQVITLIIKDYNEVVKPDPNRWMVEYPPITFAIERYVSYTGVNTAEAENILMLIGALLVAFKPSESDKIEMFRAIDWKTELVKLLFKKKKFSNPSDKLDKKFSMAAAKACLDNDTEIGTHHEADAVCLSTIKFIRKK